MDKLESAARSENMRRIRSKNTAPEIAVRSAAHKLGLRFRLHGSALPGRPDLVFPKYQTVVFVHGCFWHRHEGCVRSTTPSTRTAFWLEKFARNVARDATVLEALRRLGWRCIVLWECEIKDAEKLRSRLRGVAAPVESPVQIRHI